MRAFSVNKYYYATKKVKTAEARAWEDEISRFLDEEKELTDMADCHKESGGSFTITITVQYPHHYFYNNLGIISSKTFDCSNVEKPLLDMILGHRMGINDKFVTAMHSYKGIGPTWQILIRLELHPQ